MQDKEIRLIIGDVEIKTWDSASIDSAIDIVTSLQKSYGLD